MALKPPADFEADVSVLARASDSVDERRENDAADYSARSDIVEESRSNETAEQIAGLNQLAASSGILLLVVFFLDYCLLHSNFFDEVGLDPQNISPLQHLQLLQEVPWLEESSHTVMCIMAISAFAQALTGFGFAIVAVGSLTSIPWVLHSSVFEDIQPITATLGAVVGWLLLFPKARTLPWGEILALLVPATVLTPLGIKLVEVVDVSTVTNGLGAVILAFVAYLLVGSKPPSWLSSTPAGYVAGGLAGILGGAFDLQGPPLVVYGNAKGWDPTTFRDIVLAIVTLNSTLIVGFDLMEGRLWDFYYSYFSLTSLPVVVFGLAAGQWASSRVDGTMFKNIVLVMCTVIGAKLLIAS